MGELKKTNGEREVPSVLVATKYLPSLNNTVWEISDSIADVPTYEQNPLDKAEQLFIKRSRISVEILKRPSDNTTKYDLFQRLNAGGTTANPQELRNCITIMVNHEYAQFLKRLAENATFRNVIDANEDQIEKQKHLEYVSRFMVYTYIPYDGKLDVEEYIDDGIVQLATNAEMTISEEAFNKTFEYLDNAFGNNSLRRLQNGAHSGRVGLSAYECLAIGIAQNIEFIKNQQDPVEYVRTRISAFWMHPDIDQFFSSGLRGTTRIQRTLSFGKDWFSQ